MNACVVVPTYNERANIGPLLEALERLPVPGLTVLVVDDSSPDGTGDLVRSFADRHPRVALLSRPRKEGLGRAYASAWDALLRHPSEVPLPFDTTPDVIVQMDADFSHNPQDVPRLLHTLEHADLAIGSRYVPGGGVSNWSLGRQWLSRAANEYARLLTGVPLNDLTGGFNAWRGDLLRRTETSSTTANGYGYIIALKVRASRLGARIREVPITFTERQHGQSKMSAHVVREAAVLAVKLGFFDRP